MFLSTCESVMTVRIFTVMSAEDMAPARSQGEDAQKHQLGTQTIHDRNRLVCRVTFIQITVVPGHFLMYS